MPSAEITLTDMPDVIMKEVLNKLDFISILSLRKVARSFRDFIDSNKPDFAIPEICIEFQRDSISVWTKILNYRYFAENGECKLVYRKGGKIDLLSKTLQDYNFLNAACRDLSILLRFQKSPLSHLKLETRFFIGKVSLENQEEILKQFLDNLKNMMIGRDHPLQVVKFSQSIYEEKQLMSFLPYIDQKAIKSLLIIHYGKKEELDIGDLTDMELWRNLEEIEISNFYITAETLKKFTHFFKAEITVKTLRLEDLAMLKVALLNSPHFKRFTLYYEEGDDDEMFEQFGEPYIWRTETGIWGRNQKIWYFWNRNTNSALSMTPSRGFRTIIAFARIPFSSIPGRYLMQHELQF
ncbi:hypothetical protein CRE_09441 [Caenorhabditis remanei]|uniref:F-box domain-containing protein n=1 Tax=Caenorhabditis remanei TaxID=31234 RepID=E3LIW0_CAERE|nr:hypothetical protein CRE_09441 [Caenorhabditis remanei]